MLRLCFTIWLAVTLTFLALRVATTDAIESKLRQNAASPAQIEASRARFGLDESLPVQYINYWRDLSQGDLGRSLVTQERVNRMIADQLPATLQLGAAALAFATLWGLLLGLWATHHHTTLANGSRAMIALSLAVPVYWSGTLVIWLFSRELMILGLPTGGNRGPQSIILPALVLGFHAGGSIGEVVAASLRSQIDETFMQTAQAKGLGRWRRTEHALRPALPPIITMLAIQAGFILSGTVIIEIIFTRQGIGKLLHQAVLDGDYPLVQGLVLGSALIYALTRMLSDGLRRLADPRRADKA